MLPAFMLAGVSAIEGAEHELQKLMLRLRYASVPVVAAIRGLALGGGCELALHCARRVAALESYIGLVEVGVGLVPRGANPPNTSLPRHQAFMALETSISVAVNVGSDGDLGANWLLLDPQQYAVQQVGDGGLCPFARYNAADGYFYVAGGGNHVNLARSRTLQVGSWSNPPASPAIAVGCTDHAEDCSPGSPVARLSGYYSGYVSGSSAGDFARALASHALTAALSHSYTHARAHAQRLPAVGQRQRPRGQGLPAEPH
jgi:hypothetical protein